MRFGDTQISQQRRHRFRRHRRATIGVDRVRRRPVPGDRVGEEIRGQVGLLDGGHDPTRVEPGVDVDQYIKVEVHPLRRAAELQIKFAIARIDRPRSRRSWVWSYRSLGVIGPHGVWPQRHDRDERVRFGVQGRDDRLG